MSRHSRIIAWGAAAGLVVAGVACAVLIGAGTGAILAIMLIGGGLVLATSVVFFEVGLSEDRDREREQERERRRASRTRTDRPSRRRLQRPRPRRRP